MGWAPPPMPSREVLDKLRANGHFDAWIAEERRFLQARIVHAGEMKRYCFKMLVGFSLTAIVLSIISLLMQ